MMALGELEPAILVHSDTQAERERTYLFRRKWEPWLVAHGLEVRTVCPLVAPFDEGQVQMPVYLPGGTGRLDRNCTRDWKVMPTRRAIRAILAERGHSAGPGAVELWLGYSLDELVTRVKPSRVKYIVNRYPLIEREMDRAACVQWLRNHDLDVPVKSACTFCPMRSKVGWQRLKVRGGHDWREAVRMDRQVQTMRQAFVHKSGSPLETAVMVPEDFGASQLDLFAFDEFEDSEDCFEGPCHT